MSPFYEKKKINTNKKNVQLKINFGEQYESKLGVTVFIGRSSKREEVLRDVNNLFGLNIHECWAVFQLKHKNETMASSTLIKAEEIFQSTKSSILNTTVHGKDIFDSISYKIKASGCNTFCSVVFDVGNEILDQILSFLNKFDYLFKSPVNDFIDIKITAKNNLKEMISAKNFSFGQSIGAGNVLIHSEHWAPFAEFIKPSSVFQEILQEFLSFEGNVCIDNPKTEGVKSFAEYIQTLFYPLIEICKENTLAHEFFCSFGKDFLPELEFWLRFNNYGIHFAISCEDLSFLFESIDS